MTNTQTQYLKFNGVALASTTAATLGKHLITNGLTNPLSIDTLKMLGFSVASSILSVAASNLLPIYEIDKNIANIGTAVTYSGLVHSAQSLFEGLKTLHDFEGFKAAPGKAWSSIKDINQAQYGAFGIDAIGALAINAAFDHFITNDSNQEIDSNQEFEFECVEFGSNQEIEFVEYGM